MNTNFRHFTNSALGRISFLFGVILLCFALDSTAKPANNTFITRFDQYGNICWEDEQARLDNFSIQLQNNPNLFGDIVVYAGRNSCPDEAKYRAERAKKWVVKRGVKPERFQVRVGGYRSDVQTILALVPPGREPLSFEPTLKKEEVSIRKHCVDKVFAKVLCLNR